MNSKTDTLAARRAALVERCADQRAQVAYGYASLASPAALGTIPAVMVEHRKTALVAAGVAAGLFIFRPKWAVGIATGAMSAYQLARRLLPVLRWKGFEVH
ncbi:hypothetical protein [Massilia sp. H6]|uniref:hypothetical protein n=1 Tax=Massilia sp. H6 TaxID=2970464 RepID=UPI0021689D2A|nr:hypothetical protein [Massilia sp. H6]UVW29477.1 hypothetical protein NRS07_04925 [Massilia sp. H6]